MAPQRAHVLLENDTCTHTHCAYIMPCAYHTGHVHGYTTHHTHATTHVHVNVPHTHTMHKHATHHPHVHTPSHNTDMYAYTDHTHIHLTHTLLKHTPYTTPLHKYTYAYTYHTQHIDTINHIRPCHMCTTPHIPHICTCAVCIQSGLSLNGPLFYLSYMPHQELHTDLCHQQFGHSDTAVSALLNGSQSCWVPTWPLCVCPRGHFIHMSITPALRELETKLAESLCLLVTQYVLCNKSF